jgi:hypothetical protein
MKRHQFHQQANLGVAATALAVTPQRGNPKSSPSFEVMTAADIARQVNGKRISPTEVLEGAIARIAMPVKNGARGETVGPNQINGEAVDPFIGWCMTFFTNMTGNPAASIPAGLVDGLPVGMQIIDPTHGDVNVLAASAAFEQARPWLGIYDTIRR